MTKFIVLNILLTGGKVIIATDRIEYVTESDRQTVVSTMGDVYFIVSQTVEEVIAMLEDKS